MRILGMDSNDVSIENCQSHSLIVIEELEIPCRSSLGEKAKFKTVLATSPTTLSPD